MIRYRPQTAYSTSSFSRILEDEPDTGASILTTCNEGKGFAGSPLKAIRQARKAEAVPSLETDIRAMLKRFQSFEQPSSLTAHGKEDLKREVQTARGPATSTGIDFKIQKARPVTRDGGGHNSRDSGFHLDGQPTSPKGFGWKPPQTAMGRLSSVSVSSQSTMSQRPSTSSNVGSSAAMPSASVPGPIRAFADVLAPPAEPPLHKRGVPQTASGNYFSSGSSTSLSNSMSSVNQAGRHGLLPPMPNARTLETFTNLGTFQIC